MVSRINLWNFLLISLSIYAVVALVRSLAMLAQGFGPKGVHRLRLAGGVPGRQPMDPLEMGEPSGSQDSDLVQWRLPEQIQDRLPRP